VVRPVSQRESSCPVLCSYVPGCGNSAFQRGVDIYSDAHARLASRDLNRADIVLICIPEEVLAKVSSVERKATETERRRAKELERSRASKQLDLFDLLDEVEEAPEDFLKRDLRLALKARALRHRLPIQLVTESLLSDSARNQDPATRAWNFSVGIYYKTGGAPHGVKKRPSPQHHPAVSSKTL
jgi:hypothetical protein